MDFSPNWYDASFTQCSAIVIPAAFRTAHLWNGKAFEVKNTQLPSQQKAPGICFAAKHKNSYFDNHASNEGVANSHNDTNFYILKTLCSKSSILKTLRNLYLHVRPCVRIHQDRGWWLHQGFPHRPHSTSRSDGQRWKKLGRESLQERPQDHHHLIHPES